jgi:diacylglycerol O-acyltransferase / wax synthase
MNMPTRHLKTERLSPVDTAWLRMEDPTNLMMITGIFIFDEPIDFARLQKRIRERVLSYDRFQQRVVVPRLPAKLPFWQDDPHFDLNAHLHRIALPAPGDQDTLQALVNDFMSSPLDYSKPLWQFHLVENYGTGCALLCRLHHAIGDGIALMRVLLTMTDDEPDPPMAPTETSRDGKRSASSSRLKPIQTAVNSTQRMLTSFWRDGLVSHPLEIAKLGASSSVALARLLLLPPDPTTPFKGDLGVRKHCAWTKPIPLDDIKALGKVTSGTVNDILLTAVSGALGRYLRQRGEPIGGLNFRAVVPVNLRPPDEKPRLGNAFGLVFLSLPVGIADPLDRLRELKRRMDNLKATPEAVVAFGILNAIGVSVDQVQDVVVGIFGTKATAVMTNVPGPRETRYFAGKPIRGIMFWVPQSGRLGLGVSILSYASEVLVGIASDAGLVPDPETIVMAFHDELDSMMELVRLAHEADKEALVHCRALTKSGRSCRNRVQPDSQYCHLHQDLAD